MPRQRGIGMRKPKKKAVAQPSEAVEIPSDPPAASETEAPPSPDPKQAIRQRPPQSPGMKAVKAAAYAAQKAARVASKAQIMFLKDKLQLYQFSVTKIESILRIGREWKKQGRPAHSSHLHRWNKAELELEKKRVRCLQSQVVACELRLDAKDAAIAERDARLHRLNRLLRRKNGRVSRQL